MKNVADPEPARQDSTLRSRRNVVYTSDIVGGRDRKTPARAADDIERFLYGELAAMAQLWNQPAPLA